MSLDAKSTFKWTSNPALDALADPGGGIKGGGIHPEGQRRQTLTSRRRLRAQHRLAQERAASWGIARNGHHRARTWPPRWIRRARPGGEAGPVRPANGKADLNKQHDEQYPTITCTSGTSGVANR